jgi:hypothetical protein
MESTRIQKHNHIGMAREFSTEIQRQFSGETMVFSTKGMGTISQHRPKQEPFLNLTAYKN